MDFKQTQQAYTRLKDQLEQGRITADEFETRVNEMVVTDSTGVLWQIGVSSGKWYRYDGQTWVEDVPREILSDGQSYPAQPAFIQVPVFPPTQASPQYAEQPKRRNWIGGCLIAGALGLCSLIMAVGGWLAWNYNPSPVPPLVATLPRPAIPSVPAVVPSTPSPEPLAGPGFAPDLVQFQDDFSNPGSGWGIHQGSNGSTDYSNGSFRIKVTKASQLVWTNPNQSLQNDISINVEATKAGGPDDNEFGVICRYQDSDNFYYLFITSDGHAGIFMFKNNEGTLLTGDALISSDAIKQGAATNSIRADCAGSTLTLYANNQQIASVTDSSFSSGDVGLIAAANETPDVDILFDNFIVFKAGY